MKTGSLFTGYSGLDMAVNEHYGAETVWTSDIDPGACKIIAHHYPGVPNHGDITAVDWSRVEPVDILTGGFPCQDLSHAGKRAGMHDGTRSGLWSHMAEAIRQLRPEYVVAENVRGLLSAGATSDLEPCPWCLGGPADGEPHLRALGCVLGDLAELGYDARWIGLRAADVGAPHGRFRIFIVARDSNLTRLEGRRSSGRCSDERSTRPASMGTAAHTPGDRRHEGWPESARQLGGSDAAQCGSIAADTDSDGLQGIRRVEPLRRDADRRGGADLAWGNYEPAIRRWERVLGRPAPAPTEEGAKGGQRLSPLFVEWMMGLPAGHVTDTPGLSRNAQLKALGNGVVPQQALAALRVMDSLEAAA